MIKLYTIGHSHHSLDQFIRLLEENGIMTLVDVRSAPYSRYNPHFNKEQLEAALRERDIQYAYAGKFPAGVPPTRLATKAAPCPSKAQITCMR